MTSRSVSDEIDHDAGLRLSEILNLRVIQQLLGHSNIQTTCLSTHISIEELREAPSPMELLKDPEAEGNAVAEHETPPESDEAA